MTISRSSQISLDETPYYHCIARCVRRAFLCGEDHYTGADFNHRRGWLVNRLKLQASIFGIDICAYAIMNNHYHAVLRVNRNRVLQWNDEEVITRWTQLFRGPILVQRRIEGQPLSAAENDTLKGIVAVWRARLHDISWFMRCLNEYIARMANAEDDCRGRFWEGRFKSQALLGDAALLSCMAYVDLNPIRGGMASNLEDSEFTSVRERLQSATAGQQNKPRPIEESTLLSFSDSVKGDRIAGNIPFKLGDYVALLEATGRVVRSDKRGYIPAEESFGLDQLSLNTEQWLDLTLKIQASAPQAIGNAARLRQYAEASGRRWVHGVSNLGRILGTA